MNLEERGKLLDGLASNLPQIVAESLTCIGESGCLEAEDVSVTFHEKERRDVMAHDVMIEIKAHDLPGRHDDIDTRTDDIVAALETFMNMREEIRLCQRALRFSVWIGLVCGGHRSGKFGS